MKLEVQDLELIEHAEETRRTLYRPGRHEVASALRTQSGELFAGIHIEANVGFADVCGEVAAICHAVAHGHGDLDTIVALGGDGPVPFQIQTRRPPAKELAEIRGNQIVYLKTLENRDVVTTPLQGFTSSSPKDNDIRIENSRLGVGMRITADRPLSSESLWSIRSVLAMEPFVSMSIEPGNEFTWKSTYNYYTLPADTK